MHQLNHVFDKTVEEEIVKSFSAPAGENPGKNFLATIWHRSNKSFKRKKLGEFMVRSAAPVSFHSAPIPINAELFYERLGCATIAARSKFMAKFIVGKRRNKLSFDFSFGA